MTVVVFLAFRFNIVIKTKRSKSSHNNNFGSWLRILSKTNCTCSASILGMGRLLVEFQSQKFGFIKRVDKSWITTMKDSENLKEKNRQEKYMQTSWVMSKELPACPLISCFSLTEIIDYSHCVDGMGQIVLKNINTAVVYLKFFFTLVQTKGRNWKPKVLTTIRSKGMPTPQKILFLLNK